MYYYSKTSKNIFGVSICKTSITVAEMSGYVVSTIKYNYPVVENNTVREMTRYEKIKAGLEYLKVYEYLDHINKIVVYDPSYVVPPPVPPNDGLASDEDLAAVITNLSGLTSTVNSINASTEVKLASLGNNITALQTDITNVINTQIADIQTDLSELNTNLTGTINTQIADLSTRLDNIDFTPVYNEINSVSLSLSTMRSNLEGQIATLDTKVNTDIAESITSLQTQIDTQIVALNTSIQAQITGVSTLLNEKIGVIDGILADSADLREMAESIPAVLSAFNSFDYTVADIQARLLATETGLTNVTSTLTSMLEPLTLTVNNHISNTSNPHNVTMSQLGFDQIDNVSDLNKPISILTQTALDTKVNKEEGKSLSEANFTTAEKTKLAGLEASKFKGLFLSTTELIGKYPIVASGSYAFIDSGTSVDLIAWSSTASEWQIVTGESTQLTASQVKSLYESNPDTASFTTALKAKLEALPTNTELETRLLSVISEQSVYTRDEITAQLLTKANVTDIYNKTEINNMISTKVDKVDGRGLSECNYTLPEKAKLMAINSSISAIEVVDLVYDCGDSSLSEEVSGAYLLLDGGDSSTLT